MDCIFCKLAHTKSLTEILYEDDYAELSRIKFGGSGACADYTEKHISSMNAVTVEDSGMPMH